MEFQPSTLPKPQLPIPFKQYLAPDWPLGYTSKASGEWDIRIHKRRYVEAGALIVLSGSWHVIPEVHERVRMAIARERAAAMVSRIASSADDAT